MTDPIDSPGTPPDPAQPTDPALGSGRRLFRNTVLNGFGVFFTVALGIVLVPFTIDHLGAEAYGVWVLALSFSLSGGYLGLADVGLQSSIVKFASEAHAKGDHRRLSDIVTTALATFAATGVLAIGVLFVVGGLSSTLFDVPAHLETALRMLLFLLAGEIGLGLPGLAFLGLLEGLQRYPAIRAVDLARQVVYAILVVIVLSRGGGVVAFGLLTPLTGALGAIGYYVAARRACPELRISRDHLARSTFRSLLSFGGWVFVGKINGVIWRQMDKIILATILSSSVLAGYDIANKIQAAAAALMSFTAWAVMPAASSLRATSDHDRLRQLLIRGTLYSTAFAIPIVVGAIVMARPLIVHWVGSDFEAMTGPTQMFLSYQFIAVLATVANNMLVGFGRVRETTVYVTFAAAVNLGISVALAPHFGVRGVIAGTLIGYGITAPLYIRLVLKELGMSAWPFLRDGIGRLVPWALLYAAVLDLTRRTFPPSNLVAVGLLVLPALALYGFGVLRVAMSSGERGALLDYVRPARVDRSRPER